MKLASALAALLGAAFPAVINSQECALGSFTLEFEGTCDAAAVYEAYADQVFDVAGATTPGCTTTAEEDLDAKLAAAGFSDASELCDEVYKTQNEVPFTDAANRGTDLHFEQMFYNGRGDWQEEVETTYETENNAHTSRLREDAAHIRQFFRGVAQGKRVSWPGELPNFQSSVSDEDGSPTCTTSAAMCCWPKDRQANDNNGNCASPYDKNCVDKDPADNTDLCFVDTERGNASTGIEGSDIIVFPGDNNDGEGAIHCHGFAWGNDSNDHTARYKANNLFFVSMYDHLHQRGYVENIPGAPMCGCVEQMPTVSRSDCTQVDLTETVSITYDSDTTTFDSRLTAVHINFNACRGINNRNNDLWAYMGRLYYQGDITADQWGEAGRIITNTGCEEATNFALNGMSLTPGYDHDIGTWTHIAGREAMHLRDPFGPTALAESLVGGDNHMGIIYRVCQTCTQTHMKIFYRRITAVPENFNLINNILYAHQVQTGNVWNVDFSLHSTLEDAESNLNPWRCPNDVFNYGATFYGECSPSGARVRHQQSRFNHSWERNNVGFYVYKPEDQGLQVIPTTPIKRSTSSWAGGLALEGPDGTIYMNSLGRDIWGHNDDFTYMSEEVVDGDAHHVVTVHVSEIRPTYSQSWTRSGIQIRQDLDSDAAHYSVYLTGGEGICPQSRQTKGAYTNHWGPCLHRGLKSAWLKVEKMSDTYISYYGTDTGGVITWAELHRREIPAIAEGSYYVGLAGSSIHNAPQEVVFESYEAGVYFFPSMAPTISASPTGVTSVITELAVATQSSTCHGGVPSRAIDRNPDYNWWSNSVIHTCWDANPWWKVDLGNDNTHINAVRVYNRGDCCKYRFRNTFLEVLSADGTVVSSKPFEGDLDVYRFNFGNVVGRYVKINRLQQEYLNFAEVEIMGYMA